MLRTPREVRNALTYVLLNARRPAPPVAMPRGWLLAIGWRRGGFHLDSSVPRILHLHARARVR